LVTSRDIGRVLLAGGALSTDGVPFTVRCGRDTMTQSDIDAGRLVAEFELLAAQPIQRIVVVLALRDAPSLMALRAAWEDIVAEALCCTLQAAR
jgi:phage tail sheath protein FI